MCTFLICYPKLSFLCPSLVFPGVPLVPFSEAGLLVHTRVIHRVNCLSPVGTRLRGSSKKTGDRVKEWRPGIHTSTFTFALSQKGDMRTNLPSSTWKTKSSRATVKAASAAKEKGKATQSTLNGNKGHVQLRPKHAKMEGSPSGATQPQAKTKKPLSDATKVKFTMVPEYEPVGVSAPKLVHDEAFRTRKFIERAPVFWCDFDLDVLKQRPKKCAAEQDEMQTIVDAMKDRPERATSCIVVDRKGHILIAYFSEREMMHSNDICWVFKDKEGEGEDENETEERLAPAKPLKHKYKRKAEATQKALTMEELLAKRAEFFLKKAKREISKRAHQGTQDFAADRQPHLEERDVRHAIPDDSNAQTSTFDPRLVDLPASTVAPRERASKGTRINTHLRGSRKKNMSAFEENPDKPDGSARERCGVYHLVHSWHPQGSSVNDQIGPSADMAAGTTAQSKAVVHYFRVTYEFVLVVSERFRHISTHFFTHLLGVQQTHKRATDASDGTASL
ncbi:hypothetical protein B0H10DRAFT_1945923 [Mycena sp. CBHHK59/15]|nr:hypothetical protein B0H10DRAFT_1945923 [Mycena sp. CBHHK59/15]